LAIALSAGSVLDSSALRTFETSRSKSAALSGLTVLNSRPTGAENVRVAVADGAGGAGTGLAPGSVGPGTGCPGTPGTCPGTAGCC
jgi:hypothetical protein